MSEVEASPLRLNQWLRRLVLFSAAAAISAACIGVIVRFVTLFQLIHMPLSSVYISFNSILSLALGGATVIAFLHNKWSVARFLSLLLSGTNLFLLSEQLFEFNHEFGGRVARFFLKIFDGQTPPLVTAAFLVAGICLYLLSFRIKKPIVIEGVASAGLVLAACAVVIMSAFAVKLSPLYVGKYLSAPPVLTALGLFSLGLGIFCFAWREVETGFRASNGNHVWLPLPVGLALLATTLFLSYLLLTREKELQVNIVQTETTFIQYAISLRMDARTLALLNLSRRWPTWYVTSNVQWQQLTNAYLEPELGYQSLTLIDTRGKVRWYAEAKNGQAPLWSTATQKPIEPALFDAIRDSGHVAVRHTGEFQKGDNVIEVYVPIFSEETNRHFDGMIRGMIPVEKLFEKVVSEISQSYSIQVFDEKGTLIYSRQINRRDHEILFNEVSIELYGCKWRLQVWPSAEELRKIQSALPQMALCLGLIISGILTLTAHLGQKSSISSRQIQLTNQALQREIEERRNAEATMRHYEKLAILGAFASEVAHEIGTPLNVISGRAELLMNRLGPTHPSLADLKVIVEQIDRVSRIIQNILDFAKRKKPQLSPCDVNALIKKTLNFFEPQLKAKAIKAHFHAGMNLSPFTCDDDQIIQVLINLVANALQAMPRGGRIDIYTREDRNDKGAPQLEINIHDSGDGIDPENLERIFDPFFSRRPGGEGSGLGLAVCKHIIANHSGEIRVKSTKGEGTMFTLFFPSTLAQE